ncbi:MAG: ABC transporter permease [Chloroflexi bacterium]|nr:ABC transporter permease [Chloroflexota bacterium]MCL5074695.1 ABC transporter permease [Chloroflexota bacterium]
MMNSLRAIYIMWLRDLLRLKRDQARVVTSLAQPILWLLLIGTGLSPVMRFGIGPGSNAIGFDYLKFMFPGVLGMSILFTSMFSGMSIAWDREFGFLKEILVAPVPRWAIAVGKVMGGSTVAVVQGALMLVLAPFLGITLTPAIILKLLPLMFLVSFAITSLGVAIAAGTRSMEGFQMITQFVLLPLFMLSGAVFPLRNLPEWMEILVKLNPVAYGVDPIRQVILRPSVPSAVMETISFNSVQVDLAVVVGFTVLMLLFAMGRFSTQQ